MLKAFSRCGYLDLKMIKENLKIADRRITNFQRDGYIEKVSYLNKETKNAEFSYRLTEKGKDLCTNQLNIENFYRSSSPVHDLVLAKNYFSIKEEYRDSWITESQFRNMFQQHMNKLQVNDHDKWQELNNLWEENLISPPDGGYITNTGTVIAVEIVTSSYRKEEIKAKEIFAKTLKIQYNQLRT